MTGFAEKPKFCSTKLSQEVNFTLPDARRARSCTCVLTMECRPSRTLHYMNRKTQLETEERHLELIHKMVELYVEWHIGLQ